jgi:hypothetical protein
MNLAIIFNDCFGQFYGVRNGYFNRCNGFEVFVTEYNCGIDGINNDAHAFDGFIRSGFRINGKDQFVHFTRVFRRVPSISIDRIRATLKN